MGFWKTALNVTCAVLDVLGGDDNDADLEQHSNSMGGYRINGKDMGHDEAEGAKARGEIFDNERPL